MPVRGRPWLIWFLILVLGQLSVRAFLGGSALLVAPSGRLVGLQTSQLDSTPFADFFVPGLVLLLAFGVVPAVLCYGVYANRWWALQGAVTVAIALLLWIFVEVIVGFDRPTIYLNLGTSIGILSFAMHPAVRCDFRGASA